MSSADLPRLTGTREDVDPPEWAGGYDIGDTIHFRIPSLDTVASAEVIGFSTCADWPGLPVIEPDETVKEGFLTVGKNPGETIVVPEKHHVPASEVESDD